MAEPPLKDVLAIAELPAEAATKRDSAALDAKVDILRAEMAKRFDDLDTD